MAMEGNCVLRARTWKIVHMMRMRDFLLSREIMVNSAYPHLIQRGEPLKLSFLTVLLLSYFDGGLERGIISLKLINELHNWKSWLQLLVSKGARSPMFRKFRQAVLMYTSRLIWKERNAKVLRTKFHHQVSKVCNLSYKWEIWQSKGKLSHHWWSIEAVGAWLV